MKAMLSLTLAELRRFRGPLPVLSALFLVCVPLLYGAIYLWSNWDPYGSLDRLTVAVVNRDEPVSVQGQDIHGGQDLVDQLLADRSSFTWHPTDSTDAAVGVGDGRYAFSITVPQDFSASLAAVATGEPRRAEVNIAFDNSQGYILGIMAETAEKELQSQLNAAAVKAYADAALGALPQLRAGLDEASTAAGQLADGSSRVADGVATLEDKVKPVVAEVTGALKAGSKEAVGVSADVVRTTTEVVDLAKEVDQRQDTLSQAIADFSSAHPELADDPLLKKLRADAAKVSSVTGDVKDTTGRIAKDAARVAGVVKEVDAKVPQIVSAAQTAVDQIDQLRDGAAKVAGGNAKLEKALGKARDALPDLSAADRARDADAVSNPVLMTTSVANPAQVYGRGLAPFFFGIALWVFGLVAFVLMRPISSRGLASSTSPVVVALGGWVPPALLGAAGALLLLAVTDFGLGLSPIDRVTTGAVSVLAIWAFTALAQALRIWLGLVGSAIMLVILIVQLGGAGGLYPVQVMPAFFQAVHPFLPMTYLVDALRVTISGGRTSQLLAGVWVLTGLLLLALAASSVAAWRQRVWTPTTLHPPLAE